MPNHTSDQHPWFKRSVNREGNYTNYYVWRNATYANNGTRILPNNWVSLAMRSSVIPVYGGEKVSIIFQIIIFFPFILGKRIHGFGMGMERTETAVLSASVFGKATGFKRQRRKRP